MLIVVRWDLEDIKPKKMPKNLQIEIEKMRRHVIYMVTLCRIILILIMIMIMMISYNNDDDANDDADK